VCHIRMTADTMDVLATGLAIEMRVQGFHLLLESLGLEELRLGLGCIYIYIYIYI
jgi:hypothetical protein